MQTVIAINEKAYPKMVERMLGKGKVTISSTNNYKAKKIEICKMSFKI